MNHNYNIGEKIKKLRKAGRLTLQDLSQTTGLSIGFLSQLERGRSSIAIDTLSKIAAVLNVELTSFFTEEENTDTGNVMRSHELSWKEISCEIIQANLSSCESEFSILPRLHKLLPFKKCKNDRPQTYSHEGEEFIYVIEGALTVTVDGKSFVLYKGDSVQINSTTEHNWMNHTDQMTVILSVNYPNPSIK